MALTFFRDKVAIVTGASSGIGRATALALAREGALVTLASRNESSLRVVAEAITAMGSDSLVLHADVTQKDQVDRLVSETLQKWGRIDIVIANAGDYIRCPIIEMTIADLERSMAVNFYGAMHLVLAALPHMSKAQSGHIVLVSSMDSKKGLPLDGPYVAAKSAITGIGDVMRQELRKYGISVSIILPGRVDTPMIAHLRVPLISVKIPAETVAQVILRAIHRREAEVIVPPLAVLLKYFHTFSPQLSDWCVKFFHLEGWER
jgi:NAD(P)-dependent dehydrogenase (short-subunit alcohol dehydrogenase family)